MDEHTFIKNNITDIHNIFWVFLTKIMKCFIKV